MSRQSKLYLLTNYFSAPMVRIMTQEDFKHIRIQPLHRFLQITAIGERRLTGILYAYYSDRCHTMTHHMMFVHQLMPPQTFLITIEHTAVSLQSANRMIVAIFTIIMISPNRIDAI